MDNDFSFVGDGGNALGGSNRLGTSGNRHCRFGSGGTGFGSGGGNFGGDYDVD